MRTDMPSSWKEQTLYSSSPYAHKRSYLAEAAEKDFLAEEVELLDCDSPFARSRTSTFGNAEEQQLQQKQKIEFVHREKNPKVKKSRENRGLITCDTAALMEGGKVLSANSKRRDYARNSKSAAGTSSSLPNVKSLKKAHTLPKEAAGEALVSGSNSDDEASSSSLSDDTSESSEGGRRDSNISIEDALMQKIVASLNSGIAGNDGVGGNETPMEVSWSEDGEPSESVV